MPFYDLSPKESVLRAEFSTFCETSSTERKNNISLALKSLDGAFIEPNAEFSFNDTVGERTVEKGYKNAKIISKGKFVDGIGGGVCQVSTTLYNALILADIKIIEWHSHSLVVSYVEPSFDAMVSYGYADLKFINNTHNPLMIKTVFSGDKLTVKLFGEPMDYRIERKSTVLEQIVGNDIIKLDKELKTDLYEGERAVVIPKKDGCKSKGEIVKISGGKVLEKIEIRKDYYKKIDGLVVEGVRKRQQ
ncbi:MAG: VanW family protein [Clostridia bacterium]|nr:VanW family protein [Clostridia bacterium]